MPVLSVSSKFGWLPRPRSYEEEDAAVQQQGSPVAEADSPLQEVEETPDAPSEEPAKATLVQSVPSADPLGADPLSAAAGLNAFDPLSQAEENPLGADRIKEVYDPLSQAAIEEKENPGIHLRKLAMDGFVPWKAKKASILKKYTTNERVNISVNFMENEGLGAAGPTDTVRDRLEELAESDDPDKKTIAISQQEYLDKIETMHTELLEAWNNNQRVQALKIVIQCSKLLADTAVIKFYPSKFVLITEILDTFGRLVFDRLRGRSVIYDSINAVPVPLPESFRAEDVTPHARETCRNWFFKIASIRELIPRLFVEMALVNSYRFLANDTFVAIVSRMTAMLKGIGDPLVATYARAYLARKGREVGVYTSDYVLSMFFDHIDTYVGLGTPDKATNKPSKLAKIAASCGQEMPEYLDLYTPAMQWLLQCIGHSAEHDTLDVVLKKYKQTNNPLILDHILEAFQPSVIAPRALELSLLIKDADEVIFPKLYRTLGMNLVLCAPPSSLRLKVMNEIWKVVAELPKISEYMAVVEVFIEFPSRYCGTKEVNALLGDVLEHVKVDHIYEEYQQEIESILMKVLSHQKNFLAIFSMASFMPLADLLRGDVQVNVNKAMLVSFCQNKKPTTDPVLINAMFEVGKVVHDSINSLSFEDEIRQIAGLISIFIKKMAEADGVSRGTKIVINLTEEHKEFAEEQRIKGIVGKYSNFVNFDIKLNGDKVNTVEALWTRMPGEISDEEHNAFYKFIAHAYDKPLYKLHFRADTPLNLSSIFYVPTQHTEKFGYGQMEPGISLYCRKVLIQHGVKKLLPDYLRFVKGVVDCEDIPLNLSREHLQDSTLIARLGKVLTRRILKFLSDEAKKDKEQYLKFFGEYGNFLKEGCTPGGGEKEQIANLLRFESTKLEEKELTSLDEYIERMQEGQEEIYYLVAPKREYALSSPYYEHFKRKGQEVLFMFTMMDDWVMNNVTTYKGKKLKSIEQFQVEDDKEEESEVDKKATQQLTDWIKDSLQEHVIAVKESKRLVDSPAVILDHESISMRRMMMVADRDRAPKLPKQTLEVNVGHPIMKALAKQREERPDIAKTVIRQVYDNALVSAGLMFDPRSMVGRLNDLMLASLDPTAKKED